MHKASSLSMSLRPERRPATPGLLRISAYTHVCRNAAFAPWLRLQDHLLLPAVTKGKNISSLLDCALLHTGALVPWPFSRCAGIVSSTIVTLGLCCHKGLHWPEQIYCWKRCPKEVSTFCLQTLLLNEPPTLNSKVQQPKPDAAMDRAGPCITECVLSSLHQGILPFS